MKTYRVFLEIQGDFVRIGTIRQEVSGAEGTFAYEPEYLRSENAVPVSLSLPLREEPYSPEQTRTFFEGLLPEGFTRRTVARNLRVDEGDFIALLDELGSECLGAVRISSGEYDAEPGYEKLTSAQVRDLAAEGAVKSAEFVIRSHISLTGASGKAGLYYDKDSGIWYLPKGTAPSTHIVKQSHVRLDSIVTNERLSLLTAAKCGLDVPSSFIINTGRGRDEDILFATERYDREFLDPEKKIAGLAVPLRLHQEDFAQALGIPAENKYERSSEQYMARMFELLRNVSADPIRDMMRLWDAVVFNYLLGNTDAHIKNFSLIYSRDMKQVRLAKLYDIISTVVYESSTRDMAFRIGGKCSIDEIDEGSFRMAAREARLGEKMAMERYQSLASRFREALLQSADELRSEGFKRAEEIAGQILARGGISRFQM